MILRGVEHDITEQYEKIQSRKDLNELEKEQEMVKLIRPYLDTENYQHLTQHPYDYHYFINDRTKFKTLVSYKGLERKEIEVNGDYGKTGEEKTVFADGNLASGYYYNQCGGLHYRWASEQDDPSFQAALDAYRMKREKLATALEKSPHNADLLREQGAFFMQFHNFDEAEFTYFELQEHHPKNLSGTVGLIDVRLHRAAVEYKYGIEDKEMATKKARYEEMLSDYRKILKIDRNHLAARHGESLALLYLGRWSEIDKKARDFSGYQSSFEEQSKNAFAGRNLAVANFRNAKLDDFNFSGSDLSHADFSGASINNCDFTGTRLSHAKFQNLIGAYAAKFRDAKLQQPDFSGADLSNADFVGTHLHKVNFSHAGLYSTLLTKTKIYKSSFNNAAINSSDFTDANLAETTFRNLQSANEVKFPGARLRDLDFSEANLDSAIFNDANLSSVNFTKANLTYADFPKATMHHVNFKGANFERADFKNTILQDIDFSKLDLHESEFDSAKISQTDFSEANLEEAGFANVTLHSSNFFKAKLQSSSFDSAVISHTNFSEANLNEANFRTAKLQKKVKLTKAYTCVDYQYLWPEGFDLKAAGARICL
jgi:uncharacterized protein YjbI with pentapeptide repeats